MSPERRTRYSRLWVIDTRHWIVAAHPDDAAVLRPKLAVVQGDVNLGLERFARRERVRVQLPLELVRVVADEQVPLGHPRMLEALEHEDALEPEHTTDRLGTAPTVPLATPARPAPPRTAAPPPRTPTSQQRATPSDREQREHSLTLLWPLSAGRDTTAIAIPPDGMTLGRDPQLGDARIDTDTVSWRHAKLEWTADGWRITDLGSTNGTYVGGRRIGETILRQGDLVRLGRKVTFRFLANDVPFLPTVHAERDALP
jgi:hypothetical protein